MYEDYLAHYGVLGMKWGVRHDRQNSSSSWRQTHAEKNAALQQKVTNILKNKKNAINNPTDYARFQYLDAKFSTRVRRVVTGAVLKTVTQDMVTNDIQRYRNLSKGDLLGRLANVALNTVMTMSLSGVLARSAAKRYDDNGNLRKGEKNRAFTKQDLAETAVGVALYVLPFVHMAAQMKMSKILRDRAENEANFAKWGGNILKQPIGKFVFSGDGYDVFDPQNR